MYVTFTRGAVRRVHTSDDVHLSSCHHAGCAHHPEKPPPTHLPPKAPAPTNQPLRNVVVTPGFEQLRIKLQETRVSGFLHEPTSSAPLGKCHGRVCRIAGGKGFSSVGHGHAAFQSGRTVLHPTGEEGHLLLWHLLASTGWSPCPDFGRSHRHALVSRCFRLPFPSDVGGGGESSHLLPSSLVRCLQSLGSIFNQVEF